METPAPPNIQHLYVYEEALAARHNLDAALATTEKLRRRPRWVS